MKSRTSLIVLAIFILNLSAVSRIMGQTVYTISDNSKYYITPTTFPTTPGPGSIIRITQARTAPLKFQNLEGTQENPILVINDGGQVVLTTTGWGAMVFENCRHIKVSGGGVAGIRYGFKLTGASCGLAFSELSTDCFAEQVEVAGTGNTFFGIFAKKDYSGVPPVPYPVFDRLVIRNCYIHDVEEGMYIGETITPGMEFRHVRIYNNVVVNTLRESIQIANAVEDVEIYNNVCLNAGIAGGLYQDNCIQIGGNSVARAYRNVISGAHGYGFIVLGMGQIDVFENYSAANLSNFIDDRYTPLADAPVSFRNNYFRSLTGTEAIKNMNQVNPIYITGNRYDSPATFFLNAGGTPPVLEVSGNQMTVVPELLFTLNGGLFVPDPGNAEYYEGMGPVEGLTHSFVYPPPPVERIVLNSSMITDEVPGGSLVKPLYLCNEQSLNPDLNQHPVSVSWKPANNTKKAPYSVYFDLGKEYYLDRICLHNMSTVGPVVVSSGTPGSWTQLFTDPCKTKNSWLTHSAGITTRYVRITLTTNIKVMINEIALFGYAIPKAPDTDGERFKTGSAENLPIAETLKIYPNPATDHVMLNAPLATGRESWILRNSEGRMMSHGILSPTTRVPVREYPSGLYFIQTQSSDGGIITFKVMIQHE